MRWLLDLFVRPATRAPGATLVALLVVTIGFGLAATRLEVSTDLGDFAPSGGRADQLAAVEERFGAGVAIQVLFDAGDGGDVLSQGHLAAADQLATDLTDDPDLAPLLAPDATDLPAVITYAEPFAQAADAVGEPLAELDEATLGALVDVLFEDEAASAQVGALFSDDLTTDPARARAGIGLVELAPELDSDQVRVASEAVERVVADADTPGLRVSVLSGTAIEDGLQEGIARDIPLLLSLAMVLVVGALAFLYRTVSDVIVVFVGLLATIVWMVGTAALLGPGVLGLTGPFGQTSIAVPVLLVGLGVDYSVHLTVRYREQQARGDAPAAAAATTVRSVGVALVLATIATVGGFLANVSSPLQPIADIGIFAAIGIVGAFVIFGLAVPSVRVLLDRRREVSATAPSDGAAGTRRPRWTERLTSLTVGHPVIVLVVAGALVAVGGVAALGLGTEFEERDFLPDGAPVTATIDRLDRSFGGDVSETTYVLVDGPTDDPAFLAAAAELEAAVGELDDVRRAGDEAQITSAFELVDRLGLRGERVRDALAADLVAWDDPAASADDLPIPDPLPESAVADALDADPDAVELPDELADALADRLPADRSAALALALSGDPEVLRDAAREAFAADAADDRPADLDDAALARLAALPAGDLDVATLEAAGFPLDDLDSADRDALATGDRLRDLGWDPDGSTTDASDGAARIAVVADQAPDELARYLDDDGLVLVVSSSAGQDGAEPFADAIDTIAADTVPDGEATAVSQLLIQAEIIGSLSAAQLQAIVISLAIAGGLLVISTLATDRSALLGLIGIAPAATALVLVLGSMRVLGLSFNALTATVASIAVGVGVPYGIHLTNRFRASLVAEGSIRAAVADTLANTGGALVGSGITTGLAFGVLGVSTSVPLRQFGLVSALMITYALVACLAVQPTLLALWARRRVGRDDDRAVAAARPADRDRIEHPVRG